jgi:hypothetical protein
MWAGDLVKYFPGDTVPVEVVANAAGTVATRGKGVEITGETDDLTQVRLGASTEGHGVGFLSEDPSDFSGSQADYNAGDSAGRASLVLLKPVVILSPATGYTPEVADDVRFDGNGDLVEATGLTAAGQGGAVTNTLGVDGNGNLETDNGSDIEVPLREGLPFGEVFRTLADGFDEATAVQVAVHR